MEDCPVCNGSALRWALAGRRHDAEGAALAAAGALRRSRDGCPVARCWALPGEACMFPRRFACARRRDADERDELIRRLEEVERVVTPEHVAARFAELAAEVGLGVCLDCGGNLAARTVASPGIPGRPGSGGVHDQVYCPRCCRCDADGLCEWCQRCPACCPCAAMRQGTYDTGEWRPDAGPPAG